MIINIEWTLFLQLFINKTGFIYLIENESDWEFYTNDGALVIHTRVNKFETREENLIFIDRYMMFSNIIKAVSIKNQKISFNIQNDL